MFTPSELRNKLKSGHGLDKKEMEQLLNELSADYELLFHEKEDLKKKTEELEESIRYYQSIEKTLQKALILAEKTSQDIKATALREAEAIELEARAKADQIKAQSTKNIELLEHKTLNLIHQYDFFRIQFENLLNAQLKLINSESFMINTNDFMYREEQISEALKEPRQFEESPEELELKQFEMIKDTKEQSIRTEDGFEFIHLVD